MAQIKTIGVVGAGQMGAGIAQVSAASGFSTLLFDVNPASLEKGMTGIKSWLGKAVEKQKITAAQQQTTLANLTASTSLKDFAKCDLVIEAIVEKAEIKAKLFGELETIVPAHTIFGTNTSSISITQLAAASKRPDKVVGIHFMNPVPVMQLVELIRGLQTSDETYEAAKACSEKMGKITVLAKDSPGFIVNRILCPMINEAVYLLQEGVKAEDIDAAMKLGTNQPMGPLQLADFVGLETLVYILRILHAELGEDKYRPCPLLVKYVEAGWYGKKSGRGFYKY